MNGINYSSLMNNAGLFSNQTNKDEANITGFTGVNRKAARRNAAAKAADARQANADNDTYESGQARNVKAGYSRPKSTESGYKAIDSEGIQEGIQLSDAAKNLLAELKEKYGNMDIAVAEWSTDEEQDYYASLSSKDYSVLINPELLEKMAADPSAREEYEAILSGAGDKFDSLQEQLGEDADKVKGFSITLDKDGKVSYAVKLLKDMTESSKVDKKEDTEAKKQQKRIEEKRTERKKAEEERLEKVTQKKQETEKVAAGSIEELVKAIREKLHPEQAEETEEE